MRLKINSTLHRLNSAMSDRTNNEEKIFFPISLIFDDFYDIYPKHVKMRKFHYNGQIWGNNVTF